MNNNKVYLSTSDTVIKWNQRYKPGGTAIITSINITQQTKEKKTMINSEDGQL